MAASAAPCCHRGKPGPPNAVSSAKTTLVSRFAGVTLSRPSDAFVLSCVLRPFPASGASVDDVEERLMHRYACARRAALFPGTPLLYAHEWLAGTPASPYRGGTRAPPTSS